MLVLDLGRLKVAYFELHGRLHRDGHASVSPEVQEATLRRSAFLNDEYLVLPDPVGHHLNESAYADGALQAVEESWTPEASRKGNE